MEIDHYNVLGLPSGEKGAKLTDADIKKAYKTKALELHPDKSPDDPNANINFQKLQSSYDFLKDEIKRKRYDDLLRSRVHRQRQSSQVDSRKRQRQSSQQGSTKRKRSADLQEGVQEKLQKLVKDLDRIILDMRKFGEQLGRLSPNFGSSRQKSNRGRRKRTPAKKK